MWNSQYQWEDMQKLQITSTHREHYYIAFDKMMFWESFAHLGAATASKECLSKCYGHTTLLE